MMFTHSQHKSDTVTWPGKCHFVRAAKLQRLARRPGVEGWKLFDVLLKAAGREERLAQGVCVQGDPDASAVSADRQFLG